MSQEPPLKVAAWLSQLPSSPSPSPSTDSPTQDSSSKTCSPTQYTPSKTSQKRTRLDDNQSGLRRQHTESCQPLTHTVLTELSLNMMNTPSPSHQKRAPKRVKVSEQMTGPQTDPSRHSYEAVSRPPTTTPDNSSGIKLTINESRVRAAAAVQGMNFEDEDSYESFKEFKAYIENMVFAERGSVMRTESVKSIKKWKAENATKDERSFFAGLIRKVIKDTRDGPGSNKRSFADEVARQAVTFESDGLEKREDCLFVKGLLPLRQSPAEAAAQGLTTAKPDFVYGLKCPRFAEFGAPLSIETQAAIEVAPLVRHAFFSVDNKGSQHSIEAAENQSMRAGATMVKARRYLNRKAKGKLGPNLPGRDVTCTDAVMGNTATITDAAMSDPFVTPADAEASITAPQADESQEADSVVDTSSFAFTCSWVPQMANLHVHWCEQRRGGFEVYHMNLLRGYLMSDNDHLSHFRKDVHNILDYGVSAERKETLKQLERDIAEHERESR